jgi:hypothetical protein
MRINPYYRRAYSDTLNNTFYPTQTDRQTDRQTVRATAYRLAREMGVSNVFNPEAEIAGRDC